MKQLDVVADSIARHFDLCRDDHHDRLSVITFGSAENLDRVLSLEHAEMFMPVPIAYKIRRVESEYGMRTKTVRLEPGEVRYEEPIAFVFDEGTDQGLSLDSYPWGDW